MRLALQITSWIAIVIGVFALIGSEGEPYTLIGAMFFLVQGTLSLIYINQKEK
jgi:hypothetical protein